ALNFGYMNGRYGSAGAVWYGVPPSKIPFGAARKTNDGFYNPWAGVFCNESDAYGFAFSDRSGPSPAVSLQNNQTLRITILPDRRLDSPKVTVTATNSTSVSLRWPGIPGATGYEVDVLVPGRHPRVHVPAGSSNVVTSLTGLSPGTPYTFTVTAVGSANGRTVHSPGIPMQVQTPGALVPVNVPGGVQFSFSFNWIPANPSGLGVHINGVPLSYVPSSQQWLNNGANAAASGIMGTNEYVLTVNDGSGVIFANIIATSFSGTPSSFDVGLHHLVGNLVPLSLAAPPNQPPYTPNALVIGVPFVPNPTKAFSPVRFPSHSYAEWAAGYPDLLDAAPSGNPDLDGAVNLVEYFRGTLPDEGESSRFEGIEAEPDAVLFRYRKSQRTLDLVETIEWTTDFHRWFTAGVVPVGDEDFGNWMLRTVRVPIPPGQPLYVRYTVGPATTE
ncbi:MAG: fibronectin type III domain-containing protein, partial [Verrucomicrobia bacterium]|nr:fibronectin type III domain-containing protein [Verrucomicrobiota bacterium]